MLEILKNLSAQKNPNSYTRGSVNNQRNRNLRTSAHVKTPTFSELSSQSCFSA